MLEQIQSLIDSIDSYKDLSDRGEKNGQEVRELILESIDKIWKILGRNGVSIGKIMGTLEKSDTVANGEYKTKMDLLNEIVVRGTQIKEGLKPKEIEKISREAKLDFIKGILSFFGLPNVELFILRGTIGAIERPIVNTKIRSSVILREEIKEAKKNQATKGLNLEEIAPYVAVHSSLLDRRAAIRNIIDDELISPLAEQGPFNETKRYREAVDLYMKKEGKTEEIVRAERRVQHLEILAQGKSGKGLDAMLKRARIRLETELKKYKSIAEGRLKSDTPIEISDIVHDVVRQFGIAISHKKEHSSPKESASITSERIIGKLKRAMAIVVHHKFPELKKLQTNQGEIQKMIQQFEKILEKYQALLVENEDTEGGKAIMVSMKMELDEWEARSNSLLEEYSVRDIRMLRNTVIESLTSTI